MLSRPTIAGTVRRRPTITKMEFQEAMQAVLIETAMNNNENANVNVATKSTQGIKTRLSSDANGVQVGKAPLNSDVSNSRGLKTHLSGVRVGKTTLSSDASAGRGGKRDPKWARVLGVPKDEVEASKERKRVEKLAKKRGAPNHTAVFLSYQAEMTVADVKMHVLGKSARLDLDDSKAMIFI